MSNTWFQFRQFRIAQEHCAMKVSTDACILGAWTPVLPPVRYILDIGTGTGLLALMLAQQTAETVWIDAVEIDPAAARQAAENIAASPWKHRMAVREDDAITWLPPHRYDLIITNPPFFSNSLPAKDVRRHMARHDDTLSQEKLFAFLRNHLHEDGYAAVLLPVPASQMLEAVILQYGWYIRHRLCIHPAEHIPPNRVVLLFGAKQNGEKTGESTMPIRTVTGSYTAAFRALMQPFYLDTFWRD